MQDVLLVDVMEFLGVKVEYIRRSTETTGYGKLEEIVLLIEVGENIADA